MHVSRKLFGGLSAAVILTYLAVVAVGLYMPLQNDEIGELFLHHRALIDDKTLISLLPQCGTEVFSHPLPLIGYLPAYFNYLTYGQIDHPIWIRVGGIIQFFIWLGLWLAICMKLFAVQKNLWWAALAVLLAVLGLDALPLALLVNRPEQILLIGAGTFVALALYAEDFRGKSAACLLGTFWLFFTSMYVHSFHPKSVALIPLELVMTFAFLNGAWRNRTVAILGAAAAGWIGVQSYWIDIHSLQCPESAEVRNFILEQYLPLRTAWEAPLKFIASSAINVLRACVSNLELDIFIRFTRVWIPISLHPLNPFFSALTYLLDVYGWLVRLTLLLFSAWIWYRFGILKTRKADQEQSGQARFSWLGLTALLFNVGAIFISLPEEMYYGASLMIPLLLLAMLFSLRLKYPQIPREGRFYGKFTIVLLGGAILNQMLLLERYAGFIATPEAYVALDINHNTLTPTQGFAKTKTDILELAAQCHIGTDHSARRVVVDDTTYLPLHYTYQPLFLADSSWICCQKEEAPPFDLHGYLQLLRRYQSNGIIARCELYPKALRVLSIEHAGFCCVPKSGIENGK